MLFYEVGSRQKIEYPFRRDGKKGLPYGVSQDPPNLCGLLVPGAYLRYLYERIRFPLVKDMNPHYQSTFPINR